VVVVDAGNEVGDIVLFLALQRVGNREAEVVVLDVGIENGPELFICQSTIPPRAAIKLDFGRHVNKIVLTSQPLF
jgi:hypothetical protein